MALENFREAPVTYTDSGASEVLAATHNYKHVLLKDERETTKTTPLLLIQPNKSFFSLKPAIEKQNISLCYLELRSTMQEEEVVFARHFLDGKILIYFFDSKLSRLQS